MTWSAMQSWVQPGLRPFLAAAVSAGGFAVVASLVPPGRLRGGIVALGLAAGWAVGMWFAVRAPQWPPSGEGDWLFYGAVLAGVASMVGPLWRADSWRPAIAGVVLLALFFVSQAPRISADAWLWAVACGVFALSNLWSVAEVGRSVQAAATFFPLAVFCLLTGAVLDSCASASAGQAVRIFAAGSGAVWIASVVLRRQLDLRPSGLVAAVVVGALLAHGHMAGRLGAPSILLLACAWPVAALAARLLHRQSGMIRAGAVALLLVVFGVAALWAVRT